MKSFLPIYFVFCILLPSAYGQVNKCTSLIFEKKFNKAFEILKSHHYEYMENPSNYPITDLTSWIETANFFLSKVKCASSNGKFVQDTSADATCVERFTMETITKVFMSDILQKRASKKGSNDDIRGAINDFEKALTFSPRSEDKKIIFYALGVAYLMIEEKIKGCDYLSKAGEIGNIEAYEVIKQYCN